MDTSPPKDIGRTYFITLAATFMASFAICWMVPIYYETGNDVHAKIVSSGVFSGFPEGLLRSYGCFVLLSEAYAYLYRSWPTMPWFDLFGIFFLSVMTTNFMSVLSWFNRSRNVHVIIFKSSALVLLLVNLVMSEPTRTGILLTGTSLLLLYKLNLNNHVALKWWLNVMAMTGMLIRVESGFLALILIQGYHYITDRDRLIIFKKSLPANMFAMLLILFINHPWTPSEKAYLELRPYQFPLWDYHQVHEHLLLDSHEDSVKLATAKRSFLADESKLNPDFFEEVHLEQADKTPDDLANYFLNLKHQLIRLKRYYNEFLEGYPSLWLAYLMIFLFMLNTVGHMRASLLNAAMFATTLLLIAIFMKMEWRLLYPMLSLSILIFITQPLTEFRIRGPEKWISAIMLLSSLTFAYRASEGHIAIKSSIEEELRIIRDELSRLPEGSLVLMDKNSTTNWYGHYFQMIDHSRLPLMIPYDNGLIFAQESHKKFLKEKLGCEEFECVTSRALSHKNAHLLASMSRKNLIINYLSEIYALRINVTPLSDSKHAQTNEPIFEGLDLYKISSQQDQGLP